MSLQLRDRDAFGVVCNCVGAWEDEFTEEHGEDALTFQDWMSRIADGGTTWVNDGGELESGPRIHFATRLTAFALDLRA